MLVKIINPNKLHDELIAAGIAPITVKHDRKEEEYIAENTWITFAEKTDMDLVQQIIDAHNPTPLPPQKTQEDYLLDLDYRLSMVELGLI